ncbi:MAG: hypothetical protein DBY32_04210 [Phascolarctobacterium sp.]|nr:MAG: hypothetical protein DBY32_04210 [Phascolarctobacterium sp.]
MYCAYQKSALNAVNTAAQTLAANEFLNFDTNRLHTGCSIQHVAGSTSVNIINHGLYQVSVNADITPTAADPITLQLVNNGEVVPGAEATITGVAGDTAHVAFTTLIRVLKSCPCVIDNTASLQVQLTEAGTVTNANIAVVKLA